MGKALIIFPEDQTTDFLIEIIEHLTAYCSQDKFEMLRIAPSDKAHDDCLAYLSKSDHKTIIFLGHGGSYYLAGARNNEYRKDKFVTTKEKPLFKNKNLFLLACRSAEFLYNIKDISINVCIGFGDLPTEIDEIIGAREQAADSYPGISSLEITKFRTILVEVIKFSLEECFNKGLTFEELYYRIRLRINKKIPEIILEERTNGNRALVNFLYQVKNEIEIEGNKKLRFI